MEDEKKSPFWFITGNLRVLISTRILWGLSRGIIYPYLSLYILALGGTPSEIGTINMVGLVAGIILYPLGGYIADRRGRVKLIGYSTILFALSHLLYMAAWRWEVVAVAQFLSMLVLFYTPALNALEADSIPPSVRGMGFAFMLAVPDATRIVAPYVGGLLIDSYGGDNAGMLQAMRICWGIATVLGFVIAYLRLRYLKETVTEEDIGGLARDESYLTMLRESYAKIVESIKWMNKSLRTIVVIEMVASFSVALSAPYWVVYATQVAGITASQFGFALLMSGIVGVLAALPMGRLIDRFGPKRMILVGLASASIIPLAFISLHYHIGSLLGVVITLCAVAVINDILMPAFATIISNLIPRSRRGRLFSILGERGVSLSIGQFWGGGFLLFPFAALGVFIGGQVYLMDPALPYMITAVTMVFGLILVYLFLEEPKEAYS